MAFERSTPLPPMGREPAWKPKIPRGHLNVSPTMDATRHADGTLTFTVKATSHETTYHRTVIVGADEGTGYASVLITPQTVVTWERLA